MMWPLTFCLVSAASLVLAFTWKPARVGLAGLALAITLILLSLISMRRTIEFVLVPVTGAYLIALLRAKKLDPRAVLGGSAAPLVNLVAALFTSAIPAGIVLGLALLAAWRAHTFQRRWVIVGSTIPTAAAVVLVFF